MVSDPRHFYLIPPQSHCTDTAATSPSPTPKIRVPSREQLVPLLTTLVCRGPGSNPVPPDLGVDTLPTELPRPVNYILDKRTCPKQWSKGIKVYQFIKREITRIHAIIGELLLSAVLFTAVINERLKSWTTGNNIILDAKLALKQTIALLTLSYIRIFNKQSN